MFARAGGKWAQQAYIKASNTGEAGTETSFGEGDQFGFSVALSADAPARPSASARAVSARSG